MRLNVAVFIFKNFFFSKVAERDNDELQKDESIHYIDCNSFSRKNYFQAVLNCRSLKVLSLSQNKLRRVPDKINVLSELEELRLDDNG